MNYKSQPFFLFLQTLTRWKKDRFSPASYLLFRMRIWSFFFIFWMHNFLKIFRSVLKSRGFPPISQLIMTYVCIEVLLVVTLPSFSQAIFKKHFKENPYFRNKLFEHSTQYFAESVTMCSSHCGQCCECFGFNVINKTCRVPVSCDPGVISGQEDGWIYFSEHVTGKSVYIIFNREESMFY